MRKRLTLLLLGSSILLLNCTEEQKGPFDIEPGRVGKLLREHRIAQLDSIYSSDSLVRDTTRMRLGRDGKVEVYEKGGKHLLTLSPAGDTLHRIGNIRIRDPRYKTLKGISMSSTFGDIKSKYEIRKVISSRNNVLILLRDSEVYFTISREDLPAGLRYNATAVEAVQIPDNAPVKYMMVGWD